MELLQGKTPGDTRVLLVAPNYHQRISNVAQTTVGPPLGLAYIAAVLEQRGFEVSILDANALDLDEQATVDAMVAGTPRVVGFTAVTPTVDQCGRLARLARERLPRCLMVLGGIHASALPEQTLRRLPAVDLVVRGEADTRFAQILEALEAGDDPAEVAGISFRDAAGEPISTPPGTAVEDLDALPFPARQLLPMERYVSPDGHGFSTILGARGCPGRCLYCSVNQLFGLRLRNRAPQLVAQEMASCHQRFGTRTFGFLDDTFTTNRRWVLQLCHALEAAGLPGKVRWFCLTRVDRVDPELLAAMRAAGCFKVELGIESGDQRVLDALGKGTKTQQVLDAFAWAREAGMETMAFVMLFSPDETPGSLRATRDLIFAADPDLWQASFCTPYPGTEMAARCRRRGIEVSDDWSRYIFLTDPVMQHPLFSRGEMLAWQRSLLRSFYFRPRIALRLLHHALRGGQWRGFLRSALSAMGRLANVDARR